MATHAGSFASYSILVRMAWTLDNSLALGIVHIKFGFAWNGKRFELNVPACQRN